MLIRRSKRKESAQPDTLLSTASSGVGGGRGSLIVVVYVIVGTRVSLLSSSLVSTVELISEIVYCVYACVW